MDNERKATRQSDLKDMLGRTQAKNELLQKGHVTIGVAFDQDDYNRSLPGDLKHIPVALQFFGDRTFIHYFIYDPNRVEIKQIPVIDADEKQRKKEKDSLRLQGYEVLDDLENELIGYRGKAPQANN